MNPTVTAEHCVDGACGLCPACEDYKRHVQAAHGRARSIDETLAQAQAAVGEAMRDLKQLPHGIGDDLELGGEEFGDLRSALHAAARQLRAAGRITAPYVDKLADMEPPQIDWGLRGAGGLVTGPYPSRVAAQHAQVHQGGHLLFRRGGGVWEPWPTSGVPALVLEGAGGGDDHV